MTCKRQTSIHPLFTRYAGFLLLPMVLWHVNAIVAVVTSIMLFVFLRSPDRIPRRMSRDEVLAAADGTILDIRDDGKTLRVSTFLSLFDVHVQYAPVDGLIIRQSYKPGEFHPAHVMEKSSYNERLATDILCDNGRDVVSVVQIAGQLAKRIDPYVSQGQHVHKGCKLGMILFGSRVDIVVDSGRYVSLVRKGQHVTAGMTVLLIKRRA